MSGVDDKSSEYNSPPAPPWGRLAVANKPSAAGSSPSRPLPLESGEFMHSREFLRRYERLPQVKKAEPQDRSRAGNTYCQPHSRAAFGYFRSKAPGK